MLCLGDLEQNPTFVIQSRVCIGKGLPAFPALKQIEGSDRGVRHCVLMKVVEVEVPQTGEGLWTYRAGGREDGVGRGGPDRACDSTSCWGEIRNGLSQSPII